MKKGNVRALATALIALVLYNLFVFLVPFEKSTVFWIGYGFTLAAFFLMCGAIYSSYVSKTDAKSRFYGFPVVRIALLYGVAQLAAGLIFMVLGDIVAPWIPILLFALLMGVAGIGFISAEAVVENIHRQDEKLKKDVTLMRSLQSKLSQMVVVCNSEVIANALRALAEEFRYSDPVSDDALLEAEGNLADAVDQLQMMMVDNQSSTDMLLQQCRRVSILLGERNRLCKLNKHS